MTRLCSHTFIVAESLVSPVKPNSCASSLRLASDESMSSNFMRSTIDVRQFSCCGFLPERFVRTASTSTSSRRSHAAFAGFAGIPTEAEADLAGVGALAEAGGDNGRDSCLPWMIASLMREKMLINAFPPRDDAGAAMIVALRRGA